MRKTPFFVTAVLAIACSALAADAVPVTVSASGKSGGHSTPADAKSYGEMFARNEAEKLCGKMGGAMDTDSLSYTCEPAHQKYGSWKTTCLATGPCTTPVPTEGFPQAWKDHVKGDCLRAGNNPTVCSCVAEKVASVNTPAEYVNGQVTELMDGYIGGCLSGG